MSMRNPFWNRQNVYNCVNEELKILKRLEHPNIIWLQEIINDPKCEHIYLVTEYHSRGSLSDQVAKLNTNMDAYNKLCKKEGRIKDMKTVGLKPSKVREYLIDMIQALYYCHKIIGLIHRDINPDNIMVNHNDEAVLINFGLSAIVEETKQILLDRKMGSYMFFAPEMFACKNGETSSQAGSFNKELSMKHGEKTDIWALGITIYYLLTGQYHCQDATAPLQLRYLIINRAINFDLIKFDKARKLLQIILEKDPEKRASLEDIANSDWLTNNGKDKIDFMVDEQFIKRSAQN